MSGKAPAESSISFRGTIAFKDAAAAQRLGVLVQELIDNTLTVFWRAKDVPSLPRELEQQLEEFRVLTFNFVNSSRTGTTQSRQKAKHDTLTEAVESASKTLREYKEGQPWNFTQVDSLEKAFATLFKSMQDMMNESESETATSICKNMATMITAAEQLRDLQDTYAWEGLHENTQTVSPVVIKQLSNRITVTTDAEDKRKLQSSLDTLQRDLPRAVEGALDYRTSKNAVSKDRFCNSVILAMQTGIDVVSRHIIGDSQFGYKGLEADKFNDALDDLLGAIERGDNDAYKRSAADVATRAKAAELADASSRLKDQTKDLLGAAKKALADKDSDDAAQYLKDLMNNMKGNMADLAAKEAAAEKRRKELLKSAGGLGLAVSGLSDSATAFREGKSQPKLDYAQIDREETAREERVAAGQPSTMVGDDELDDLLADLNTL